MPATDPYSHPYISPLPFGDLGMYTSDTNMIMMAPAPGPGQGITAESAQPQQPSLGRFLPVPRLRNTIDPRLGLTDEQVECLVRAHGVGSGGGVLPWEVRVMAGERWDLHAARRLWEVWRARFEDEEDGWDWLGEGQVGVQIARGLVGWEDEEDWEEEGDEDEEAEEADEEGKLEKGEEKRERVADGEGA
jgi:hypothetical protein